MSIEILNLKVKSWSFVKSKRFDKRYWEEYFLYSLLVSGDLYSNSFNKENFRVFLNKFKVQWDSSKGMNIFTDPFSLLESYKTSFVDHRFISQGKGYFIKPKFDILDVLEIEACFNNGKLTRIKRIEKL